MVEKQKHREALITKVYLEGNSIRKVAKQLNIPQSTVFTYLKQNHVRLRAKQEARQTREDIWSLEEIELLRILFPKMKVKDIHRRYFPNRTFRAIRSKIAKLGLYKGHISESYENNRNAVGFKHTDELKERFSRMRKGVPLSLEHKLKIGKAHLGQKKSKEECRKIKERMIKRWKDPEFAKRMAKVLSLKPNRKEKELFKIIEQVCPGEYEFVGDGKVIIDGLIPDFINVNGEKKIIEFFGDYWHSNEITGGNYRRSEEGRKKIFGKFGYKTLVIWQSDFDQSPENEIKNKVKEFSRC